MPDPIKEALARVRGEAAAARAPATAPATPALLVPEHVVQPDALPRGPKAIANAIDAAWSAEWWHSETEALDNPKRGGVAYGVRFRHPDGRHGWAVWLQGKFAGAFIYPSTRNYVPRGMKAAELKQELSDG